MAAWQMNTSVNWQDLCTNRKVDQPVTNRLAVQVIERPGRAIATLGQANGSLGCWRAAVVSAQ
jgi:hypothetical protein